MRCLNELSQLHSLLEFVAGEIDWENKLDFKGVSEKKKYLLIKKLWKSIDNLAKIIEEINEL